MSIAMHISGVFASWEGPADAERIGDAVLAGARLIREVGGLHALSDDLEPTREWGNISRALSASGWRRALEVAETVGPLRAPRRPWSYGADERDPSPPQDGAE